MAARNPARYVAPVALIAVVLGGYLIVHHNLGTHHPHAGRHHTAADVAPRGKFKRAKFYTVQPGETLTSISNTTGVPLTTLESLNPTVNPNALQAGQRIRLRR